MNKMKTRKVVCNSLCLPSFIIYCEMTMMGREGVSERKRTDNKKKRKGKEKERNDR